MGPAAVLTAATGYLTWLGVAVELGLGRLAPRKGAWANAALAGGLVAFGVFGLLPASWPVVALGLVGGTVAMLGLSKIDTWLSTRARGPPPARPQRDATAADLDRFRREAIVSPGGRGVVLVAPGERLRAHALELRVPAGEVVLVMHGDRDGFFYPTPEAEVRVSAAQVAGLLEQLLPPAAGSGQLTVCACSVAAGPAARELAQRAGRPVVGSTGAVWVHRPGRHGARVTTAGSWLRVAGTGPVEVVECAAVAGVADGGARRRAAGPARGGAADRAARAAGPGGRCPAARTRTLSGC